MVGVRWIEMAQTHAPVSVVEPHVALHAEELMHKGSENGMQSDLDSVGFSA